VACGNDDDDNGDNDQSQSDNETPAVEEITITVGDIADDPVEVIEGTQPIADYVAANLSEYGITNAEVRIAASIDEMAELLANGEVDLYFDSAYPATVVSQRSGGEIVLRRWRFGVSEYHTVFFTLPDSGITSIEDLAGRKLAVEQEFSTSGYVLPVTYLIENGLEVARLGAADEAVPDDTVGYVFTGDDDNNVLWVLEGIVDAGVADNLTLDFAFSEELEQLVVIAETDPLPRQVVVLRPNLDPELHDAIIEVLKHAHESEAGQAALLIFGDTTKFDEFPEGTEEMTSHMLDLAAIIQSLN
jgi:phosphonate transport system substrate-binding protein